MYTKLSNFNKILKMKLFLYTILFFYMNTRLLPAEVNRQDSISVGKILLGFNNFNLSSNINNRTISTSKFKISDFNFEFNSIKFNRGKNNDTNYDFDIIGPMIKIRNIKSDINFDYFNFIYYTLSYLEQKRLEVPKDGLKIFSQQHKKYLSENKNRFVSFDKLVTSGLISIKKYPYNIPKWSYYNNSTENFIARSNTSNISKDIIEVLYNSNEEKYSGYKYPLELLDTISWNLELSINDLIQEFSANINLEITKDLFAYSIFQKKSKFNIVDLFATLSRKDNKYGDIKIVLPNLELNTNNLNIIKSRLDNNFKILNGELSIIIQNLKVFFSDEFNKDPDIKNIMGLLGVRNNQLKIPLFSLEFELDDEKYITLKAVLKTPYLRIKIDGNITLGDSQLDISDIYFNDVRLVVDPVSYGIRNYIKEFEKKNNYNLRRRNSSIYIDVNGLFKKPNIQGLQ